MHDALAQQMKRFEKGYSASFPSVALTREGKGYVDPAVNMAWQDFSQAEWASDMSRMGAGSGPFPRRGQAQKMA